MHPGLVNSPSPPPAPARDQPTLGPPRPRRFDGHHNAHCRRHTGPASPACPTLPPPRRSFPIPAPGLPRSHAPSLRSSRVPARHPSCAGGSCPTSTQPSRISTSHPAPEAQARSTCAYAPSMPGTPRPPSSSPPPRASTPWPCASRNTVGAGWPPPSNSPEQRRADDKRVRGLPQEPPHPSSMLSGGGASWRPHGAPRDYHSPTTRPTPPRQSCSSRGSEPSRDPRCP